MRSEHRQRTDQKTWWSPAYLCPTLARSPTHFSQRTALVWCGCLLSEPRSTASARQKTCNQLWWRIRRWLIAGAHASRLTGTITWQRAYRGTILW